MLQFHGTYIKTLLDLFPDIGLEEDKFLYSTRMYLLIFSRFVASYPSVHIKANYFLFFCCYLFFSLLQSITGRILKTEELTLQDWRRIPF